MIALVLCFGCMDHSATINKDRLPEFSLVPTDYGWKGRFQGGLFRVLGQEVSFQIDTRAVPDEPKTLSPISESQAGLLRSIANALPAILQKVEKEIIAYNDFEPEFRQFLRDPQVWLSSETDDGESWTFVIERTDNPDFGYHSEFKGTNFIEIWSGD